MSLNSLARFGVILVSGLGVMQANAVTQNTKGGFVDLNVYPYLSDVEADSVATINIAANLENRFSYFSLTNFINQPATDELQDTTGYYTEQNIRWQIADQSPLDLTAQFNFRTGQDNDRHRLGFRWRMADTEWLKEYFAAVYLSWSMNFHLYQWDSEPGHVWQIEHSFRMTFPYVSDRLYLAGFIDHTFNQDLPDSYPASPVVWETQLGYEVFENFFAIAEYRVNQYNRQDVNNVAVGVEYLMKW